MDPYYLTFRAEQVGYNHEVILAGRRINDNMGAWVAQETVKRLMKAGGVSSQSRVAVLGVTFKEDVPDFRNTNVLHIVDELNEFGVQVQVCDPHADPEAVEEEYGAHLTPFEQMEKADAVILAVPHADYLAQGWSLVTGLLKPGAGLVIDVRGRLDRAAKPDGVTLWRI